MKEVSIIIPAYNCANTIERAVKSALSQDEVLEVIVVNDKSTDDTLRKLSSINDKCLKVITLTKNKGVSHARNVGIDKAAGKYIMFLDSDDYLSPRVLSEMTRSIGESTDIVFCGYRTVDENGHEIKEYSLKKQQWDSKQSAEVFFEYMDYGVTMMSSCAKLFRHKMIENLRFNEKIKNSEDFNYMIDVFSSFSPSVVFIDMIGYDYTKIPKKRKYRDSSIDDHINTVEKLCQYGRQTDKYACIENKISNYLYNQIASDLVTFVRFSSKPITSKISLFSKVRRSKPFREIPVASTFPFKRKLFVLSIKINSLCGLFVSHFVR